MNTEPYKLTIQGTNLFKNALIPQRNKFIFEQVEAAAVRMGQQNFTKSVMDVAVMDFKMICESRMDYYSLEEISSVLQLGALGELGDAIGMSSRTLASWVKNYQEKYRVQIAKYYQEKDVVALPEPDASKELSEDEKQMYFDEMYNQFWEDGTLYPKTYDLLLEWGKVPEKCKHVKKHAPRAKLALRELQAERLQRGKINLNDFLLAINSKMTDDSPLMQECKKLALAEVFNWEKLKRK